MMDSEDEKEYSDFDEEEPSLSSSASSASNDDCYQNINNHLSPPRSQRSTAELEMANKRTPKRANITPEGGSKPKGTEVSKDLGIAPKEAGRLSGLNEFDQMRAMADAIENEYISSNLAEDKSPSPSRESLSNDQISGPNEFDQMRAMADAIENEYISSNPVEDKSDPPSNETHGADQVSGSNVKAMADTIEDKCMNSNLVEDKSKLLSNGPLSDGGSISSVSAITFDCPNDKNFHQNAKVGNGDFVPMQTIKSTLSSEEKPEDCKEEKRKGNDGDCKKSSKTKRLQTVHKKVKKLQKENASLNETNLQLLSEVAELRQIREKEKKNVMRLNAIHEKVLDIQSENDDLRRVNRLLLDKVKQFENSSLRNQFVSPQHEYLSETKPSPFTFPLHDNKRMDSWELSRIPVSPSTKNELEILREKYYGTKKRLEEQKKVCRELLDDAKKGEKEAQNSYEKKNDGKKSLGLIVKRKYQRNDRKLDKAVKKMMEFENQTNEAIRELQERKVKHMEDLGVMAELESANAQQRLLLKSLTIQVKEKDVAILNLESHIDAINKEMITMRQQGDVEKHDLHEAYEELKVEASQLVEWLKKQLAAKDKSEGNMNGMRYADEIAQAQGDDDLESLTPSEKESLLKEINQERQKLMVHLPTSTRFQEFSQHLSTSGVTAKHPESVDGSTLTPISQI